MKFTFSLSLLLSCCILAMGQRICKTDSTDVVNKIFGWNKFGKPHDFRLPTKWYSVIRSSAVTVQNSFPKGGPYTDPNGNQFGYQISWSRLVNDSNTPLEITISFPASILPLPESFFKLFIPSDTMTLDKVLLYDYGATGLKSFLDTGMNSPTMFKRTVNPNEDCIFYVGAVSNDQYGMVRTELVVEGEKLFYRITGIRPELDLVLIPCGHITVKE